MKKLIVLLALLVSGISFSNTNTNVSKSKSLCKWIKNPNIYVSKEIDLINHSQLKGDIYCDVENDYMTYYVGIGNIEIGLLYNLREKKELTYENIFVKDYQSDNKITFPYFKGGKSLTKKFDKMSYDKFLHYDMNLQDSINTTIKHELEEKGIKNKKRIMLGDIKRHYSPKIYIRQSSKEIISSVYLEPSTSNNSLYSLCINNGENFTKNKSLTLNSVCSQLNSNITTYYAQKLKIIRSGNGKQPQIKLSDLKKIRLTDDPERNKTLENRYNKIQRNLLDCETAVDAIDKILAQFYGLSADELEYIKEEISL